MLAGTRVVDIHRMKTITKSDRAGRRDDELIKKLFYFYKGKFLKNVF